MTQQDLSARRTRSEGAQAKVSAPVAPRLRRGAMPVPAVLDAQYNNRLLVPAFAEHLTRWAEASAQARATEACALDLPYGAGQAEKLDVFRAAGNSNGTAHGAGGAAPVLVFIHGGYWRSLDKADHSFVAPAFTRQGACVVVPNYDLCPAVTVPQIALQLVAAVR